MDWPVWVMGVYVSIHYSFCSVVFTRQCLTKISVRSELRSVKLDFLGAISTVCSPFVWPLPALWKKKKKKNSLWPPVFSPESIKTNHHRGWPLDGFKKKHAKSFLLYSNGRVFVCSYLMWVNVSGSQSGGLHPASNGPHCSLKTPLCVIETC